MSNKSLFQDYLSSLPSALKFYGADFRGIAARKSAVLQAAKRKVTPELFKLIAAMNPEVENSEQGAKNLKKLSTPGTVAVVTGQQVGLFGGPLLVLYKALSAVKYARELEGETGVPCVPVFWLQTEDHNTAEINHLSALSSRGERIDLELEIKSEFVSVAHRTLGSNVMGAVEALSAAFQGFQNVDLVGRALNASYQPHASFAAAFQGIFEMLLPDLGLIFFNPRFPGVAPHLAGVFEKAFSEHETIEQKLTQRSAELQSAGYEPQVPLKENSPLCFFHPDGATGSRYRLQKVEGGFQYHPHSGAEVEVSASSLMSLLQSAPEQFSSSALLRPIMQDTLFPTAAIVGGPSEVGYFAQVSALYSTFHLPFPLILPRARFVLLDKKLEQWCAELNIQVSDITFPQFRPEEVVQRNNPEALGNAENLHQAAKSAVDAVIQNYKLAYLKLEDPTLQKPLAKAHEQILSQISSLDARLKRALTQKDEVALTRLKKLQEQLFPDKTEQERVYSWLSFVARFGGDFLKAVESSITLSSTEQKTLIL